VSARRELTVSSSFQEKQHQQLNSNIKTLTNNANPQVAILLNEVVAMKKMRIKE